MSDKIGKMTPAEPPGAASAHREPSDASAVRVGTAGWSIPRPLSERFAIGGPVLLRYASQFDAVEINSSFYRPHRASTYERWAQSVPKGFSFAVKAPRQVTHDLRLVGATELLFPFRRGIERLGGKLGPVLFQLPPSLVFDDQVAGRFFDSWCAMGDGLTVCEPRHESWFSERARSLLIKAGVVLAIADPPVGGDRAPAPSDACAYWRLHGSPTMYESSYGIDRLKQLSQRLIESVAARPTWCIFDNTKYGAATSDGLALRDRLKGGAGSPA